MSDRVASVAIHAWDNGRGLSRDLQIIQGLLEGAGLTVTVVPTAAHERGVFYRTLMRRLLPRPAHDVNLFLERLVPAAFHRARHNILIPNQEWFEPADLRFLPFIDTIACRSRMAEQLFANRGAATHYIGFTSHDRHLPGTAQTDRILHIAGHSLFKGTDTLLRVWRRHPEWPVLTLVHREEVAPLATGHGNIEQLIAHVPDDELRRMQQEAWLHIQPSEAEGFGHCLGEAMSTGALVLTVNAAPMNELIQPDRGALVDWHRTEPMGVDQRYLVEESRLEAAIANLLRDTGPQLLEKGRAARQWFTANDRRFRDEFPRFIAGLGDSNLA